MIAREVGEGARRQHHAVEAALLQTMTGGFERQMGDAIARKPRENGVKLDGLRRGVPQSLRAVWTDDTDRAEARGLKARFRPKLAQERRDRSLAVGAGDRDRRLGLRAKEACGAERKPPPRVRVGNDGGVDLGLHP